MPTEARHRAVVVGSGHNGLVAACYLAKAGLDVDVVECDSVAGGAVSTVERFPGFRMDRGSSAHVMIRHTGIVEDLALTEVGLEYQDLDPWGFAPFGEVGLHFYVDLDRTCASIEAGCGQQDADAYHAFATSWARRNRAVFRAFQAEPRPRTLLRAVIDLKRSGRLPATQLANEFLTSGDALLDRTFRDERLKTALAWLGSQAGPPVHDTATADLVGWNTVMHLRAPGHPRGGSGMLTEALRRRLLALGGRLRLGDGAARITCAGGRASGVLTESGDHLQATTVVAACHVLTTVDLLGPALPDGLAERVRRTVRVGNGMGMVVRLATDALPRYPSATSDSYRSLQLLARSRDQLRAAHADFAAGRPPADPATLAMTFSAFDDTLAPPGRHNVSIWGQWHPYRLADGLSWDDIGEREGEKLVAAVDAVAPGFAGSVQAMHVQTPLDLERELGLPHGQVMHLEMGLDQMFLFRPTAGLSRYRIPGLSGVYLCGASTHPGGGVFGASGRTVAHLALSHRSRRG